MKQALSILIGILYLLGTMQVSLAFHYCGDEFQYITFHEAEEKDSCCGKSEERGCCHKCCSDKEVTYKVDDQHHSKIHFAASKLLHSLQTVNPNIIFTTRIVYPLFKVLQVSHSPPLLSNVRRHVLNCVFII